ncbi:MAG: glycosyltransferase family 2 protein [Candidatus Dadabacteria bacterium]|nr:MAG: glycosyltransferase family 2 protein [Candidatus Dadabacteria bacterium]
MRQEQPAPDVGRREAADHGTAQAGCTRLPVTAAILAHNEADRLPATLQALNQHVERIIVLDSDSDDGTAEVAMALGAEVHNHRWEGYVAARRRLLELVDAPWCLMVDADEVVPPAFWDALARTGFPDTEASAYAVRRQTIYLGKRLRYAWQPDWKTVLVRTERARIEGGAVHEYLTTPDPVVRLPVAIDHYSYRGLGDHLRKMIAYARLGAAQLEQEGRRCHWWDLTLRPAWHVVRHLLVKQAWRDGLPGWIAATSSGVAVWMRYAFLLERRLELRKG